ncbi:uncharacterized protein LOC130980694 [Arachis stenosperma]|uniref:uncharacterized protein LOC130980694 n=1 Tax=Arachis stenosperma TaxID=217475 RepID=UPI0025ABE314|nr:uncharacterized protein LOC130980694 [Arachis stenosperma]
MAANGGITNVGEQARRVFGSYTAPIPDFYGCSIAVPTIGANNFVLKPQLITLVQRNYQYHVLPQEDPNKIIFNFLKICDTVKTNGVNLRLHIFYDGLSEMAKRSLDHSAGGSLHMKKTPEEANELIEMVANN